MLQIIFGKSKNFIKTLNQNHAYKYGAIALNHLGVTEKIVGYTDMGSIIKEYAQHKLYKYGMRTQKPLEVSEKAGYPDEMILDSHSGAADDVGSVGVEREGRQESFKNLPYLTALSLSANDVEVFFEECVLTVNQDKHIVTTSLQGKSGTIKEYVSMGDYNISMVAGIQGEETNDYPLDNIGQLVQMLSLPSSLKVKSDFLSIFGIQDVVVKSFNFNQETHSNRQSVEVQLISEELYEIKLSE